MKNFRKAAAGHLIALGRGSGCRNLLVVNGRRGTAVRLIEEVMKRFQPRWLIPLAAAAVAAACQSSLTTATYREMVIDPTTLHVSLETPIPIEVDEERRAKATLGEYYQIFVGQGGGTSIDHYLQIDPGSKRMRFGHFESGSDRLLAKSSRSRAVLEGPFGTVYSEMTCFYHLPVAEYRSFIEVHAYANGFEHEAPAVTAERGENEFQSD